MKVLNGYLLREFFKLLFICEGIFIFIFLMVDFLQKIDNFIEAGASKGIMFLYFSYKSPYVAMSMLPPAAVISVIILFSSLQKKNEITALKASGVSVFALSRTILFASLFIVAGVFVFSEAVVPYTSSKSNRIWSVDVQKRDPNLFYGQNEIWYRGRNAVYWIRQFDAKEMTMSHPTFYFFDDDFGLIRRIEAKKGVWKKGGWQIEEVIILERMQGGSFDLQRFDTFCLAISETPESFTKEIRKPEEMSYRQLKRYAEMVGREGYNNMRYLVDMHIKVAFPLISLILVMIGIPLALITKKGSTPLAVSLGMAVCFLYLLTMGLSRSLGLSGVLSPLLSAWLANLFFFLSGAYLLIHVEQ
ncbi:MAG: LPS export ABC transporter permease LptG [Deltaproteobacteria bacterium]|nr:LPS export ABC transporter permease LptG [Deltaproteobacteria bacterium]